MANYVKLTDYASKDALATGNPLKLIKGTEINDEFNAIQTAVGTKADLSSPAFLGNPTAPTQAVDNSSTRIATTAFVQAQLAADATNVAITGGTIDNVTITGGFLTGLATDLAVADGGTGKSSLTANSLLVGNGTSAVNEISPSTSGNLLTSNGTSWVSSARITAIGENQTWTDYTASGRVANTTYTNNTGKPIQVLITMTVSTQTFNFYINGTVVARVGNNGFIDYAPISAIIPDGATYKVDGGINLWWELR